MAKNFYPKYWSKDDLKLLDSQGKVTDEQYKELTGEKYIEDVAQ